MSANPNRADLYLTPARRERLAAVAANMETEGKEAKDADGKLKLTAIVDYLLSKYEEQQK